MSKKLTFCIIATLAAGIVSAAANAVTTTLIVQDDFIQVGEDFTVGVYTQDETSTLGDLLSFGFDVDESLTLFSFNPPANFDNAYEDQGSEGHYVAGSYKLGQGGNAGQNVKLVDLSFTAGPTAGTEDLDVLGIYDILGFRGLFYEWDDPLIGQDLVATTEITIHTSAPLPVLLLGSGLLGYFVIRKKLRY